MFSILSPLFGTPKKKSPAHEFKIAWSFSEPPGEGASARACIHAMNQHRYEPRFTTTVINSPGPSDMMPVAII